MNTPRTHTKDGIRMSAGNRRKCSAREARELRRTEDAINRKRPVEVELEWTLNTLLELVQSYAAFWNSEAILSGLIYDGGFPSRLEVKQKNTQACIWIAGDTYPSRGQLHAWGFVWSGKKKSWYCGEGELERAKLRARTEVSLLEPLELAGVEP